MIRMTDNRVTSRIRALATGLALSRSAITTTTAARNGSCSRSGLCAPQSRRWHRRVGLTEDLPDEGVERLRNAKTGRIRRPRRRADRPRVPLPCPVPGLVLRYLSWYSDRSDAKRSKRPALRAIVRALRPAAEPAETRGLVCPVPRRPAGAWPRLRPNTPARQGRWRLDNRAPWSCFRVGWNSVCRAPICGARPSAMTAPVAYGMRPPRCSSTIRDQLSCPR